MDAPSVTIPQWVLTAVVIPMAVGLVWVLWRLGIREVERWEDEREELRRMIQDLRDELHDDHGDVEAKLDRLIEEVQS